MQSLMRLWAAKTGACAETLTPLLHSFRGLRT
jgi:hypothetical protein